MSTDFRAVAVIGFKIPLSDVVENAELKSCKCYPIFRQGKHCSECGRKIHNTQILDPNQISQIRDSKRYLNFDAFVDSNNNCMYVGVMIQTPNAHDYSSLINQLKIDGNINLSYVRDQLQKHFKNNHVFSLWAILEIR